MTWINGFRIQAIMRQSKTIPDTMHLFLFMKSMSSKEVDFPFEKKKQKQEAFFSRHLSAAPCPRILKKDFQVPQFKYIENRASGGRVPTEHTVVIADLFNSIDSNLPLSSTLLNKLVTDWVQ